MTAPHVLRCFTHNGLMFSCSGSLEFLTKHSRSEALVLMRTICSPYFTVLFYGLASTQILLHTGQGLGIWAGFFSLLFVSFCY
jgi:hypothetical protein